MLPQMPDLIVITTRTSSWINSGNPEAMFLAPTADKLIPFSGIDKFSTPFFILLKSWNTVLIYKPAQAAVVPVWQDNSFSEGWSWYLDGAYGNHSSTINSFLTMTVQAQSSNNAWMGLTKQLSNVSEATYLEIRYRIDVPSRTLEVVLWNSTGGYVAIEYLQQSSNWSNASFQLPSTISKATKIGIIIWTQDVLQHRCDVGYIMLVKIVAIGPA
jgi:hypothetical protein